MFYYGHAESVMGPDPMEWVKDQFFNRRWLALDMSCLEGVELLAAAHSEPDCEENCWVLFRKDGKLYEVVSSHCSCYGYEGTWGPTETSVEYLVTGQAWGRPDADELKDLIVNLTTSFDANGAPV